MSSRPLLPQSPAIYRRISLDRRKDELGVDRQERHALDRGDSRGWNVANAAIYTDNDKPASKKNGKLPERPDFDRLCADIEAGRVDGVLAYDLDRLLREPLEAELFYAMAERAGMHHVLTVADDVDISTGHGMVVARIKAALAAEEIRKMRQRVGDKQIELAERGMPGGGGIRPFGYSCAGRHPCRGEACDHERCCRIPGCPHDGLGLVPLEAEALQNVAAFIVSGGLVEHASGMLNICGIYTPAGNRWVPRSLNRAVSSPRVTGLRERKGEIVGDAVWPAILDRATWENVRATLKSRYRYMRPYREHLLSGIARCGHKGCGAKLYAQVVGGRRSSGKVSYTCRRQKGGCGKLGVDGERLETHVCDVVGAWLSDKRIARAIAAILEGDPGNDIERLEDAVAADEERLRQLGREREEQGWDIAEYRGMREAVVSRLDGNRAALAEARRKAVPSRFAGIAPEDLVGVWERMERADRRAFIAELVGELTVLPVGSRSGPRFDPERVRVVPVWAVGAA